MMWMVDRDAAHDQGAGGQRDKVLLDRYRVYGRFYDRYWARLFSVTQADLSFIAEVIRASGEAMTLTAMARRLIDLRLAHGPQLHSGPVRNGHTPDHRVRFWDPALTWLVGDRALLVVSLPDQRQTYAPRVAEVVRIEADHAVLYVDGLSALQVYPLVSLAGRVDALSDLTPRRTTEPDTLEQALKQGGHAVDEIDRILGQYGDKIVGHLLHTLEADSRFIELEGRWFLRDLIQQPREVQLVRATRTIFTAGYDPLTTEQIMALMVGVNAGGRHRIEKDDLESVLPAPSQIADALRFGLLVAIQVHPELFTNVRLPAWPLWALSGPPPARMVARHAAYDPETYEVLCMPGETLSHVDAQRLWDIGLLKVVLGAEPPPPQMPQDDHAAAFDAEPLNLAPDPEVDTVPLEEDGAGNINPGDNPSWEDEEPPDLPPAPWSLRFPFRS